MSAASIAPPDPAPVTRAGSVRLWSRFTPSVWVVRRVPLHRAADGRYVSGPVPEKMTVEKVEICDNEGRVLWIRHLDRPATEDDVIVTVGLEWE